MKKIKVLQFIHGFSMGGAETLTKEYCLKIDKERFDLLVLCFHRYHTPYEQQLEEAGIRVIYASDHIKDYEKIAFRYPERLIMLAKRWRFLRKTLREEAPDVLHIHMALSIYVLLAGLQKSTKIFRTMHTDVQRHWNQSFGRQLDLWATKKLMKRYPMRFIALHDKMKKELDEMFSVDDTVVLNNGIDFSKYEDLPDQRTVRLREHIPVDAFVMGHVGRFHEVKNHQFLVEIFQKLHEMEPKAFLLLIGNGELQKKIEEKLLDSGLEGDYKILSYCTDIPAILQAMDRFVFPSFCEGLGIAAIEAQKAGLPCVISSAVPQEAVVSNLVQKLDLERSAQEWAEIVLRFSPKEKVYDGMDAWDMREIIHALEELYC